MLQRASPFVSNAEAMMGSVRALCQESNVFERQPKQSLQTLGAGHRVNATCSVGSINGEDGAKGRNEKSIQEFSETFGT